ncbi:MAG TPA: hypothetical protein VHN80_02240, partial [Kineosporiaceae bacterium]|nr:hypothetical protein [Kineosporiaceae bacterium]
PVGVGAQVALRLFRALLPDRERVLGPDHLTTLTTLAAASGTEPPGSPVREALVELNQWMQLSSATRVGR